MLNNQEEFHQSLNLSRNQILKKIKEIFESLAIEGHVLGSVARGTPDPYSDLDIWITIEDSKWENFKENRTRYYSQIGEIIHINEAPQNAPINGIYSSVFIKTNENILVVDFYLCPKSSAFTTSESKNLFGNIELPMSELSLNPQQVSVPDTYRIDFFICFIFGTIKKIVRQKENPLELVLQQYDFLNSKYGIAVKKLQNIENSFETLKEIISNVKEVSTPKQNIVLEQIEEFIKKVRLVENL